MRRFHTRALSRDLNHMVGEADDRLGTRLGNYVLREAIGRGGAATVYRGEHVYIGKQVAVKVLRRSAANDEATRRRFLREAQAASVISHPNIVSVTDFGEEPDGTTFIVMDHVEGQSLDRVLRAEGPLPLFRSIVILSQVARGVGAAHRAGIVHRDLKPENIMLRQQSERRDIVRLVTDARGTLELADALAHYDFAMVLDFGAAKTWDAEAGPSGVVLATPAYMAPETARVGVSDARSDIYAVGVIFYQMLTGTLPFSGESPADLMMKQVIEPVEPPRVRNPHVEITAQAERVILRALAKDPQDRQQSMDELHLDLQRCYGRVRFRRNDEPVPEPAAPLRPPIQLTGGKRPTTVPPPPPAAPGPPPPLSRRVTVAPIAAILAPPPQPPPPPVVRRRGLPGATPSAVPIPLTKRKTDRRRTLSFTATPLPAADPAPPTDVTPIPTGTTPLPVREAPSATAPPRHATSPYGAPVDYTEPDEDASTPTPVRKRDPQRDP